jgi:hypothetical protein
MRGSVVVSWGALRSKAKEENGCLPSRQVKKRKEGEEGREDAIHR